MQTMQNALNRGRIIRLALAFLSLGIAVWLARSVAIAHSVGGAPSFEDHVAYNLTRAGFTTLITLSVLLLLLPPLLRFFRGAKDSTVWWFPLAVLCNVVVEKLGKTFFDLPRPNAADRNGFPSGHAMFAFMLAWLVSKKYPKLAPIFYGAAVAIGWARVEANAHFPYQVLGGALIGTLIGWAISHFVRAPVETEAVADNVLREPISRV